MVVGLPCLPAIFMPDPPTNPPPSPPPAPVTPVYPAPSVSTNIQPVFTPSIPTGTAPGQKSAGEGGRKLPIALIIVLVIFLLLAGGVIVWRLLGPRVGLEKKTLTYWGLWEPPSVMQPIIDKYQATHPGVTIVYKLQDQKDYRERLMNSLAEGKEPDILRFHNTWLPMLADSLATVPPSVYDAQSFKATFFPAASVDLVQNNKIYGIPLMYDSLALFYNLDIFQRAGKQLPQDWNDLRKTALEITSGNRDQLGRITTAGVALGTTSNVDHWQDIISLMMLQAGADLTNPTDTAAQSALKFYTIFTTEDRDWDDTLPNSTTMFIQGKLAMYFGPSWRVFDFEEAKRSQAITLNYGILPMPQLPALEGAPPSAVTWASYWAEGVGKNSKNQDVAWDFIKYLSQKDTLQAMYQAESQIRKFGELYSRADMADLLKSDPETNAFISQAPTAKSWYMASRTNDGPTGINSRLSKYFEDAINGVITDGKDPGEALKTVAAGTTQVLSDYHLVPTQPTTPR
jgi:ABC-type glycerol-3-phosphate transport system substrate-binding protein